jgi:hypothetical protein
MAVQMATKISSIFFIGQHFILFHSKTDYDQGVD